MSPLLPSPHSPTPNIPIRAIRSSRPIPCDAPWRAPASGNAESEPLESEKKCPDALAAEITTLAGHLNAAQYRFLKLLDEFDREQGWAGPGVRSLAHWLSWKCGIGELVAREKVRVARALRELPMIDASPSSAARSATPRSAP